MKYIFRVPFTLEDALKEAGLWENTVFIYSNDNGGPTNGVLAADSAGLTDKETNNNNWPLRGGWVSELVSE